MDNLSLRKDVRVRELIESTGAEALYLPPYSPGLNPIEPPSLVAEPQSPRKTGFRLPRNASIPSRKSALV